VPEKLVLTVNRGNSLSQHAAILFLREKFRVLLEVLIEFLNNI
jgi:hypothetical protein